MLYLWGIGPDGKLVVLGPHSSNRDNEYSKDYRAMIGGGVRPHEVELQTRDAGAATQILKRRYLGKTGNIQDGLQRARHVVGDQRRDGGTTLVKRPTARPGGSGAAQFTEPQTTYMEG